MGRERRDDKQSGGKQQEEALRRIEWMLTPGYAAAGDRAAPTYGDLTALNTERTILDTVGPQLLKNIVSDYLGLLDTSAAVYERNGDYALGIFASGWCRYLDEASRRLCNTDDNAEALGCGKWHCHESCWTEASKAAIERDEPTDIACAGGLRLYAAPIRAGERIIGAINFGYGDPPSDPRALKELAAKYNVAVDELTRHAAAYASRPPFIVDMAKRRIETSARLIGEIVERSQAEEKLRKSERNNAFLAQTAFELVEFTSIKEIYQYAVCKIYKLLEGNSIVALVEYYRSENRWQMQQLKGVGTKTTELSNLFGIDVYNLEGDISTKFDDKITGNKLVELEFDFPALFNDKVSSAVEKTVKKMFSIEKMYCIAFEQDKEIVGNITIITNKKSKPLNTGLIESFVQQVSNFVKKQKSEAALKESEEKFRTLVDQAPEALFLHDLEGRIVDYNRMTLERYGYTDDEILQLKARDIDPDYVEREDSGAFWDMLLKQRQTHFEARHQCKDGTIFPVHIRLSAVKLKDKKYILALAEDITERKQVTEALRSSEERFRRAIAEAPYPVMIHAEDGEVVMVNTEWTRITGYRHEEIPTVEAWTEKAYGERQGAVRQVIDGLYQAAEHTDEGNFEIRCLDGSTRIWTFRSTPLGRDETGRHLVLSMAVDITEREILESQLRQAQKMEAVGQLAGGVAHDYNNMLSVIIGYTELALDKVTSDEVLRGDFEEVLNAARRSADITRQLLAFARRQTIDPKVIDLNEAMEGMLKMLRRLIGEDIDLSWQPGAGRMPVFLDPAQLDQLLANLCINARDAIDGVGKLTIETDHVRFDEEYCADHAGFVPGNFILLAVSDDGCGMDKETLDDIFEPFFTTKGVGEGTGLGLATVYGIIKQNDGFINVYSELEKGTTFKIYLPPYAGKDAELNVQEPTELPAGHGETVLIVEDEAPVLKLAQRSLERSGYTVLTAAAPGEAMATANEHAGEIHLLITDVVLPEMNGRELAEQLIAHYPALKVLFMSGYTADVIAHRGVLEEGVNFIQKPFSNRDLSLKVREALRCE